MISIKSLLSQGYRKIVQSRDRAIERLSHNFRPDVTRLSQGYHDTIHAFQFLHSMHFLWLVWLRNMLMQLPEECKTSRYTVFLRIIALPGIITPIGLSCPTGWSQTPLLNSVCASSGWEESKATFCKLLQNVVLFRTLVYS